MGRLLGSTCFAEDEAAPTESELVGRWTSPARVWKVCGEATESFRRRARRTASKSLYRERGFVIRKPNAMVDREVSL